MASMNGYRPLQCHSYSSEIMEQSSSDKHVMISYQWDNREMVFKLRERLQEAGYRIWVDTVYMNGTILDSMANAVANADVMVICMSQKYKNSQHCRAEAEYAFQCRVPIIPLLMQSGYRADGWLGLLVDAKLYFSFGKEGSFDRAFQELVKEIGNRGKSLVKTKTSKAEAQGRSTSVTDITTLERPTLSPVEHIVISYHDYDFASAKIVPKLCERLEKVGYRVSWKQEEMKSLENADVMLMCMSQKYNNSRFCRNDAENAFKKDIQIIPLLIESDCKAESWLGIIKATKLPLDFSEPQSFDTTFEALVKYIRNKGEWLIDTKSIDNADTAAQGLSTGFKHVMLSYNLANEKIVSKLRERLEKAGYRVWRHPENTNVFDCIASAVENADVVLMCISQEYKNSPSSRTEAVYVKTKNIPIIPVFLESDYKLDGWLGLIVGYMRICYEFGEQRRFDRSFNALVKEIGNKGKCSIETKSIVKPVTAAQLDARQTTIFLSYEWEWQPQIEDLYKRLTRLGYHCWMDKYQVRPGDNLFDEIVSGIKGCKVVVSCLTERYSTRDNCKKEVQVANSLGKPIIPILLETSAWPPKEGMSMIFAGILYIDFANLHIEETWKGAGFDELLSKLESFK